MGSLLGPILEGIFIIELENMLVSKLKQHIKNWIRYVGDTFLHVKNGSVEYVLSVVEKFHPNRKFTYEKEVNNTVCSCYVTYAFESESTLYSCLNVKELLARSRREI